MLSFARHASRQRPNACRCARALVTDASAVRNNLRTLLRDTAQPVAVVTARMDPAIPHAQHPSHTHNGPKESRFHGATLSSFSSIAMDPHPLVAFSLRIPSRMATSLTSAHAHGPSSGLAHLVVNILSEHQVDTAVRFSRPDVHPEPFVGLPYSLTQEGLPVLNGSIGAISCRLVAASWKLHDLESLVGGERKREEGQWEGEGVASELFIAEVVRVERTPFEGEPRPLLYHRRDYYTTRPIVVDTS
ncbi:flavin reductase like domain-containing protein [Earliella scabrosa]|nr:flavin reductase like domain-containing protein [Earliella scabrosa]